MVNLRIIIISSVCQTNGKTLKTQDTYLGISEPSWDNSGSFFGSPGSLLGNPGHWAKLAHIKNCQYSKLDPRNLASSVLFSELDNKLVELAHLFHWAAHLWTHLKWLGPNQIYFWATLFPCFCPYIQNFSDNNPWKVWPKTIHYSPIH